MNTGLSQLTLDTLHAFAARRRMLIAVRGLCVGVVCLLAIMSLIAIVDALIVIRSQPVRWALSLGGYALVAIVVWLTCLRSLLRIPGSTELARLIEQRAPGLREDLISAVELGSPQSDARFDSPTFRALLQASVEKRLGFVEVQSLLPAGLIRGAAFLATAALLICVALLLVPDLHFASRLTRAFLPSAPVDRVSLVQVKIVAPHPADMLAPHNDAVQVVVELSGGDAENVILEAFRTEEDHQREEITLRPAGGPRQYAGTIQLGRDRVQYRVLAGDAVTRLYTIDTAARPHAVAFAKTYRAPDYADLEPRTVRDNHGDLEGIEGTRVDLVLDVDEPITRGEIQFDAAGGVQVPITLERIDDRQWGATVPIGKPTTYKVHLVAAKTGFENTFDPPYEIKSIPDAPPTLTIESPAKDTLLSPASPLTVKLSAEDDLGLARVSQWFRINGGEWVEIVFAQKPGRTWNEDRRWEMYDLNLRAGDQVAVKFAASDRAGNRTESTTVNLTISATGFDANRLAGIEAKRQLLDAIATLNATAQRHAVSAAEAAAKAPAAGQLQRKQFAMNGFESARQLREESDAAWLLARRAIKLCDSGAAAHELAHLARMLSQIRDEFMAVSQAHFERSLAGDDATMLGAVASAEKPFVATAASAKQAEAALATILAGDEADALLRDLLVLRREQQAITSDHLPDEPATWQRLARRQMLLSAQVNQAEELAGSSAPRDEMHAEALAMIRKNLSAPRLEAESTLAKDPTKAAFDRARMRMTQVIDASIARLLPVARSLASRVAAVHQDLRAADRLLFHLAAQLAEEPSQGGSGALADLALWKAAASAIKASDSMEEGRSDADATRIADTALYRRAILAIESKLPTEDAVRTRTRLTRISTAFRTLEAGHDLAEVHALAVSLASREKWLRSQAEAVTVHPRDWEAMQVWQPRVVRQMSAAGLSDEAIEMIGGLMRSSAALILDVEMSSRRVKGQIAQKRPAQFDQFATALGRSKMRIAAEMAAARAVIAAEAPTLSEQMAALSREAKVLEKQAEIASDKLEEKGATSVASDAKELEAAQAGLDAKLKELLEALRHEANAQDTMTHDGREHARDADDAAAMVRDPAAKAMAAAKQAAAADEPARQQANLKVAGKQDQQLAKSLETLAEHFENLETGKGEETRSALREAESELGIKREMDSQFGRMERLAELAQKSPAEQAAELERELKQNPAMKQELSEIAKESVGSAKEALEVAAAQERRVAQDLAEAQKAEQQAKPNLAGQMNELARKADELAKKVPPIERNATKGTAKDAAAAAGQAEQSLKEAGKVSPPADAKDHKAAASKAEALAQALKNASEQLKEAGQKAAAAAERIRDEEGAATATLAVGNASNEERLKAAETLLHAKPRQDAARRAAVAAREAAKQVDEMAEEAARMAEDVSSAANAGEDAIQKGLKKQPDIAEAVAQAGEELARAARHEERMEENEAARALDQSKERMQREAIKAIGEAAEKLAQAGQPGEAENAMRNAEKAIAGEAARLEQMLKSEPSQKPGGQGRGEPKDDQASRDEKAAKWMARALDELDRSMNDEGGKPPALALSSQGKQRLAEGEAKDGQNPGQGGKEAQPGEQGGPSAQANGGKPNGEGQPASSKAGEQASQAVSEAASAQSRAMAQARHPGGEPGDAGGQAMASKPKGGKPSGSAPGGPGESPGGEGESSKMASAQNKPGDGKGEGKGVSGGGNRGNAEEIGELPQAIATRPGDWGKLPARLARELMEGQRDEIPSEYRNQVEAYFRAIAQKAKSK